LVGAYDDGWLAFNRAARGLDRIGAVVLIDPANVLARLLSGSVLMTPDYRGGCPNATSNGCSATGRVTRWLRLFPWSLRACGSARGMALPRDPSVSVLRAGAAAGPALPGRRSLVHNSDAAADQVRCLLHRRGGGLAAPARTLPSWSSLRKLTNRFLRWSGRLWPSGTSRSVFDDCLG
jgi:pimeloyl-ACP methyl ester carboxylesterase